MKNITLFYFNIHLLVVLGKRFKSRRRWSESYRKTSVKVLFEKFFIIYTGNKVDKLF